MAHFAKVQEGIVIKVIVAESDFFKTFVDNEPGEWVQTSYNTRGGKHLDGGKPLRKNYAGIGHTYDEDRDAFYSPKPYASWILNETTCEWDPPVPYPEDGKIYIWDETNTKWTELIEESYE